MTTPQPYGSVPGQPAPYQGQPTGGQPVSGSQPAYGAQPVYGAQPAYGAPPYGTPAAPPYGAPPGYAVPGYGAAPLARPGMATAAAVLSFIWAAFAIITSLITIAATSITDAASDYCSATGDADLTSDCNSVSGYSAEFKIVSGILIVVAILLIWGGVTTLSGKNTQLAVIGAGLYIVGEIVGLIIALSTSDFAFTVVIGIVVPVLILIFLFNTQVRGWVRAKGGKTF